MQEPVLQLQDICKKFVGVIALDHVSFTLAKGEILAQTHAAAYPLKSLSVLTAAASTFRAAHKCPSHVPA